jgi:hypothetical protein
VSHRDCFVRQVTDTYSEADVEAFVVQAEAMTEHVDIVGWQDGAYVDFRCETPPTDIAAGYVGVVLHRFADPATADAAAPHWLHGRVPASNEAWPCSTQETLLVCVSATAQNGAPWVDAQAVRSQVLASAR